MRSRQDAAIFHWPANRLPPDKRGLIRQRTTMLCLFIPRLNSHCHSNQSRHPPMSLSVSSGELHELGLAEAARAIRNREFSAEVSASCSRWGNTANLALKSGPPRSSLL